MLLEHVGRHRKHMLLFVAHETTEKVVKQPANRPENAGYQIVDIGATRFGLDARHVYVLVLIKGVRTAGSSS